MPDIADVNNLIELMHQIGVEITHKKEKHILLCKNIRCEYFETEDYYKKVALKRLYNVAWPTISTFRICSSTQTGWR